MAIKKLAAGDTVEMQARNNGATRTLATVATANYLTIDRVV